MNLLYNNLGTNESGHLTFAGLDTVELAKKYGTVLMAIDEDRLRTRMRTYRDIMKKYLPEGSYPLYASKAFCFKRLYEITAEEGLGTDIVSSGELYTAASASFPLEKAYFHGNNKTDQDIKYAVDSGVGCFVIDCLEEADALEAYCASSGKKQKALLRLTTGVDPHTHAAVNTSSLDSKFGLAIATGQAEELLKHILTLPHIDLAGFHCHVGSQSFDSGCFCKAAEIIIDFMASAKEKYGMTTRELDMGGGYAVRYTVDSQRIDIEENIAQLASAIYSSCDKHGLKPPVVMLEPGRCIIADSCITLYTVGSVKEIPGHKNYVSVDGGMTDNPRYALYGSVYTVYNASDICGEYDFTADIAGRCCESGDIVAPNITLPKPKRGDIICVCTTGAYNYSMASNYNRVPRPAVLLISGGNISVAVRRESFADMMSLDV